MNLNQLSPETVHSTETANIEHFNFQASDYDERFSLSVDQSRARVKHIRQHSEREIRVGKALDLGCGTGNLTAALVLEGAAASCVGIDISSGMIEQARRKTITISDVTFQVGSATALPFADESFDLCVGDAFLHHILDIDACLKEVFRVLKPGGVATFNEPNGHGYALVEFILRALATTKDWNDENLTNYLECIGFLRENRGNLTVLGNNPLPDKHYFHFEQINSAALSAGFVKCSYVPAMGPSETTWNDAFRYLLDAIEPDPKITATVLKVAQLLDATVGDEVRKHFCLHNQFYIYK
jgi:ubiquinone/menaquinone biosynthesis C-methylase UbiE